MFTEAQCYLLPPRPQHTHTVTHTHILVLTYSSTPTHTHTHTFTVCEAPKKMDAALSFLPSNFSLCVFLMLLRNFLSVTLLRGEPRQCHSNLCVCVFSVVL